MIIIDASPPRSHVSCTSSFDSFRSCFGKLLSEDPFRKTRYRLRDLPPSTGVFPLRIFFLSPAGYSVSCEGILPRDSPSERNERGSAASGAFSPKTSGDFSLRSSLCNFLLPSLFFPPKGIRCVLVCLGGAIGLPCCGWGVFSLGCFLFFPIVLIVGL